MNALQRILQLPARQLIGLAIAVAAVIAMISGAWIWSETPDYKVLYSNLGDRDGGAVVQALGVLKVPYKFSDGGNAILVPSAMVYDARLKLASQGLPKGGITGMELMENQKFGTTQFQEQVNYQRGLEGELARTIQAVSAVQAARVHLAIPKSSVFLRDSEKPSASVFLNLYPGKALDHAQVEGILHLVSSSVPQMTADSVSIIDQNGTLLTRDSQSTSGLDPNQMAYVTDLEQSYTRRVLAIIEPITGRSNVRAQVTADIDFSQSESTNESYRPNGTPENTAIRSQQSTETSSSSPVGGGNGGVPGAASNQPGGAAAATAAPSPTSLGDSTSSHKDTTTNYELDKTVQVKRAPMGSLKRLSVAIVVNNHKTTDDKGAVTMKPLDAKQLEQIESLAREAVGFTKDRGDSLNVVNAPFTQADIDTPQPLAIWKDPENIGLAKDIGKNLALGLLACYLIFGLLRPAIKRLGQEPVREEAELQAIAAEEEAVARLPQYTENLKAVKQLARSDPKLVASVVKGWWPTMADDGVMDGAVLLLSIGEEEAAEVFKHLSPPEVQRLSEAMAKLTSITRDKVEGVLDRFQSDSDSSGTLGVDSDAYVRNVLTRALGVDRAGPLIERILKTADSEGIEGLKWMDAGSVADLIRNEHPQIIASILAHLERDQACAVLRELQDKLRNEVVLRIATLDRIKPQAMQELNQVLTKLLSGGSRPPSVALGGARTAAEILNFISSAEETEIIDNLRQHDPELAQKILDEMFVFENLLDLDDRGMQLLLREVQSESLVIALKGANEELREKVFKNMSQRAADMLREDLESKGPVRLSEVEAEQKEILSSARRLADEGQLNLGGRGDDQYV